MIWWFILGGIGKVIDLEVISRVNTWPDFSLAVGNSSIGLVRIWGLDFCNIQIEPFLCCWRLLQFELVSLAAGYSYCCQWECTCWVDLEIWIIDQKMRSQSGDLYWLDLIAYKFWARSIDLFGFLAELIWLTCLTLGLERLQRNNIQEANWALYYS